MIFSPSEHTHPSQLLDFSGKVVLVTGSSGGLGAGIAQRFAQAGADVVVCDLRPTEAICHALRAMGGSCMSYTADVTDPARVHALFDAIEQRWSAVDVLINNAGIYPIANLLDMTPEQWDQMMAVNLKSVFLMTQTAAKRMIQAGKGGAIVNIGSIEAVNPAAGHAHYSAAKAGVIMFGKTAALELGPHNIRVNAVSPSLINRPNLAQDWPEGVERFLQQAPLGRIGEVEDIADACLFLASDAARWITGTHLIVDGGVLTSQAF